MTRQGLMLPRLRRGVIASVAGVLLVSGCNGFFSNREEMLFDGAAFRTKSDKISKEDRKSFLVTVQPVSASLDGAREAGRWEGTRYCIKYFGSSSIDWDVGPDTDPGALTIDNDRLTFQGRCDP